MKSQQLKLTEDGTWVAANAAAPDDTAQVVFAFIDPSLGEATDAIAGLTSTFPKADILACSTGGEIAGADVFDGAGAATALTFEKSSTRLATATVGISDDSYRAGESLGRSLADESLAGVFVLSEGLNVNGSQLVRGLREGIGKDVPITGGLAGDGADFDVTRVGANGPLEAGQIGAIGFYGSSVRIAHGNAGGWEEFGPQRRITRACGNVLYELDGKPALDLYKKYLGDAASDLPSSGLLFPLKICRDDAAAGPDDHDAVRTILSVSEDDSSLTFAGDIPEGEAAQLMMGNFEHLITGAGDAAAQAVPGWECDSKDSIGILVSCIGRKLLLGQRTAEEVEAVAEHLDGMPTIGFYSYGELSPHSATGICELHNQTMTITLLGEA